MVGANSDDETVGITVTPVAGLVTSEGGATATFTSTGWGAFETLVLDRGTTAAFVQADADGTVTAPVDVVRSVRGVPESQSITLRPENTTDPRRGVASLVTRPLTSACRTSLSVRMPASRP